MPSGTDLGSLMIRQSLPPPAKPVARAAVAKLAVGFVVTAFSTNSLEFNFYPKSSVVLTLPVTGAGAITFRLTPVLNTNPQITATTWSGPTLGPAGGVPTGAFGVRMGPITGFVLNAAYTLTVNQNGLPITGEPVLKLRYDSVFGWTALKNIKSAGNLDVDGGLMVRTGGVTVQGTLNVSGPLNASAGIVGGGNSAFKGNVSIGTIGQTYGLYVIGSTTSAGPIIGTSNGNSLADLTVVGPAQVQNTFAISPTFGMTTLTGAPIKTQTSLEVATTVTANSFITRSDRKIKENIVADPTVYLDDLMKLQVVNFNYNSKYDAKKKKRTGLIAQDVEEVLPMLVDTNEEEKIKSISYSELVPLLISAVQTLKKAVDAQQLQIAALMKLSPLATSS